MDIALIVLASLLAVPVLILVVEVIASTFAGPSETQIAALGAPRPKMAVVIPAHNESAVLKRTLDSILPQLEDGDRVVVVADNCSDETANIARSAGVEVLERQSDSDRGKGFALDAGIRHLKQSAPDDLPAVVVFNDADVIVGEHAIETLVRQCAFAKLPVQGLYLMDLPAGDAAPKPADLISRFAFLLKNRVRPLGLWAMDCPVPLFGSGMAFPWDVIANAPLATSDLVEDMRLGMDLTNRGTPPMFCPAAAFNGELPGEQTAAVSQRRRWEHGHMNVLMSVPRVLWGGLLRGDGRRIAVGLDHAVQPLTILVGSILLVCAATVTRYFFGGTLASVATGIAVGSLFLIGLSLVITWVAHLRGEIPLRAVMGLPRYLLLRIPNQLSWLIRRQRDWVRTPRRQETGGGDATA